MISRQMENLERNCMIYKPDEEVELNVEQEIFN